MAPISTRSTRMPRSCWATRRSRTVAQRDRQREDSLQQPAGLGGILIAVGGSADRASAVLHAGKGNVMAEPFVSRGVRGRRQTEVTARRLPPGQYETRGVPGLSAGTPPPTDL